MKKKIVKKKEVPKKENQEVTGTTVMIEMPIESYSGTGFMGITPLGIDLGREDLNILRDKLNELIEKYNER